MAEQCYRQDISLSAVELGDRTGGDVKKFFAKKSAPKSANIWTRHANPFTLSTQCE